MKYYVNNHNIFEITIVTMIVSLLLVPIVKRIANHISAIDMPGQRKVHKNPMPRLGGLAIFISFLFGYMLYGEITSQMISILIGGFFIILLGIFDDIKPLSAKNKLIGQILVAAIVVFSGNMPLKNITFLGLTMHFHLFGYFLSILLIVSIINAINLIDGLDGLAAGTSSIYFLSIAIIATFLDRLNGLDITICLLMLGSIIGFLFYNFNPASIFMGDTGSMFIGLMIAVVALLGYKGATLTSLLIPLLILLLPILDTLFAILRRIIKGESIGHADSEHIHHQLLRLNKSMKKTVLSMYLLNILCASISIMYALGNNKLAMILYSILMIITLTLIYRTDILFEHKNSKK